MKLHGITCLLLGLSLTAAPVQLAESEEPSNREKTIIKQTLVEMWDAIEKGDLARYAAHLHPDFSAFGENDPYLASGRDLELRSMADYLSRVRNVHTEMHHPVVTVRGDVAWITYYWTDSGFRRAGGERFASRGKSTRIFVKQDGRWLCMHGHYTAVP